VPDPLSGPAYPVDAGSPPESTWPADIAPWDPRRSPLDHPRGFREAAALLTSRLLARHGTADFDRIEDAVQEAFVAAARAWPLRGQPSQPLAWLSRVAERRYLDLGRATRRWVPEDDTLSTADAAEEHDGAFTQTAHDPLPLLFMCCHPSLSSESRVALTLKQVSQLGVPEIARLLGAEPTAVAQRLVRAKRSLQSQRESFVVPTDAELPARLGDVLLVCYALFTAGHLPTIDDASDEASRCVEALRLVEMLRRWPPTAKPATHALAALCWFTLARQPARFVNGALVPLDLQDRGLWDRRCLARGVAALSASLTGPELTRYHVEAYLASLHSLAPSFAETPWEAVVRAYDRLLDIAPSPAARLARVVSLAHAGRHVDAQHALDDMQRDASVSGVLAAEWHATAATLAMLRGEPARAASAYEQALTSWTDQAQQHEERHHAAVRAFWTTRLAEARLSAARAIASADNKSPSTIRPQGPTPGGPAL
jgi:RNA polymerase sigma-70 factor, ECF subfamily